MKGLMGKQFWASSTARALLFSGLATTALVLWAASAAAKDCVIATDGDSKKAGLVDKACKEGGASEARRLMKKMVKAARAAGLKFEGQTANCNHCHDTKDWSLTKGTKKRFEQLLTVYAKTAE